MAVVTLTDWLVAAPVEGPKSIVVAVAPVVSTSTVVEEREVAETLEGAPEAVTEAPVVSVVGTEEVEALGAIEVGSNVSAILVSAKRVEELPEEVLADSLSKLVVWEIWEVAEMAKS